MNPKPKEEFPLKGILQSPCCSTNMTAGWSKGKNKYYMYCRCIKHCNINISGASVHQKIQELPKYISFTPEFLDKLIERVLTYQRLPLR